MPELTFRTLRNTAASLFGNDVKSAQAHLGHARADVTALHYMATPTEEPRAKLAELDQSVLGRTGVQKQLAKLTSAC
jgi:integrase